MNYMHIEMRVARCERLTKPEAEQSNEAEHEEFKKLFFQEEVQGVESCEEHCMRVMQTYEWQMEQL